MQPEPMNYCNYYRP